MNKTDFYTMSAEEFRKVFTEMYLNETEDDVFTADSILGMPIDRIEFMIQYFKEKGFDPRSDSFEQELLLSEGKYSEPLKEIKY